MAIHRLMAAFAGVLVMVALAATPAADKPAIDAPRYDAAGHLLFPANYRDWMFLTSGLNMSYAAGASPADHDMFNNVFVPRAAYAAFLKAGVWPEGTMLMLENRAGATKASINKHGQFQTDDVMGHEIHVKDTHRFKDGWAFFGFNAENPATEIPHGADCYSCHKAHAAADTTFVQFYPTVLPVATKLKTLNPAYVAEEAAAKRGQ